MEPLTLRVGEPSPLAVLNDPRERERPVVWLCNGSIQEMVSHAWMKRINLYYCQRALAYQKQMHLDMLHERNAPLGTVEAVVHAYANMEDRLQRLRESEFRPSEVWYPFMDHIAHIMDQG